MDKKFKFSEQSTKAKILYLAVIAILTVTAIVIAIASAANKAEKPDTENNPPITDGTGNESGSDESGEEEKKPEATLFSYPIEGEVAKGHSTDVPVFSETLGDFRVHTGVDISAEEGMQVQAAADGTVTKVYYDPFLGQTVELTHTEGVTSRYSNLDKEVSVKVGDSVNCGDVIGTVGDTSLSELADEVHLHFEINVNGVGVDPIKYIAEHK